MTTGGIHPVLSEQIQDEAAEKVNSGEWTIEQAEAYIIARFEEIQGLPQALEYKLQQEAFPKQQSWQEAWEYEKRFPTGNFPLERIPTQAEKIDYWKQYYAPRPEYRPLPTGTEAEMGENILLSYFGQARDAGRVPQGMTFYQWARTPEGAAVQAQTGIGLVRDVYPEYEPPPPFRPPAFDELGIKGATPYVEWFRERYPAILAEFEGEPEARSESRWGDVLRDYTEKLKAEWARYTPAQRGQRPSVFQPKIRTISAL